MTYVSAIHRHFCRNRNILSNYYIYFLIRRSAFHKMYIFLFYEAQCVDTAHEILDIWVPQYQDNTFYQWAIELKDIAEPIGSISVVNSDERVDMVEIGFCIGKSFWGQGIMTEAFQAVIDYLFGEVGVQRIEAGHDPNNPASGAVQRKCGLKYEGTFRRRIRSNQGITDVAWYSILKEEWKK